MLSQLQEQYNTTKKVRILDGGEDFILKMYAIFQQKYPDLESLEEFHNQHGQIIRSVIAYTATNPELSPLSPRELIIKEKESSKNISSLPNSAELSTAGLSTTESISKQE